MPAPFPPEFRRRAVELATTSDQPLGEIAKDPGISRSRLRTGSGSGKADTTDGSAQLTSAEKKELAEPRRRAKQFEVEPRFSSGRPHILPERTSSRSSIPADP